MIIGYDALTYARNLESLKDLPEEKKSQFIFVKGDITNLDQVNATFTSGQSRE